MWRLERRTPGGASSGIRIQLLPVCPASSRTQRALSSTRSSGAMRTDRGEVQEDPHRGLQAHRVRQARVVVLRRRHGVDAVQARRAHEISQRLQVTVHGGGHLHFGLRHRGGELSVERQAGAAEAGRADDGGGDVRRDVDDPRLRALPAEVVEDPAALLALRRSPEEAELARPPLRIERSMLACRSPGWPCEKRQSSGFARGAPISARASVRTPRSGSSSPSAPCRRRARPPRSAR